MTLRDVIDGIKCRQKTLTVFDPPSPAVVDELAEFFASQQVSIEEGTATGGPDGFAVLSDGTAALVAVDLENLMARLAGQSDSDVFADLLAHIDGTTFSTYDVRQMVATSREIEDRAWRARRGTLHAGVQTVEELTNRRALYETLARTDLDIHVYATPGQNVPSLRNVTTHFSTAEELRDTWFLVFDGGDDPSDKCALLAVERGEREFYGVWTYDPDLVDRILRYLTDRY